MMTMRKTIMLGVPCLFDERKALQRSIRSFLDPAVLVVALDNGGSDECKSALSELEREEGITVVHNDRNVYVNPAWNQLAAHFLSETESEILVIANSDIVLSRRWASHLICASETELERFWVGRQVTEGELAIEPDVSLVDNPAIWAPPGSWGAFYALRRRDVERCFPIPRDLKLHCGDDWVFSFLVRTGAYPAIVNGVRLWHAGAKNITQLREADGLTANDRRLWHSHYSFACKRAADAAIRGSKVSDLEMRYMALRDTPSDVNEHLPTIRAYAAECRHVTEFGFGWTTCAIACARPDVIRSYDPHPDETARGFSISEIVGLARSSGVDAVFYRESDLEWHIEQTEMLFIDTIHSFSQLSAELHMHSGSVLKYILMHDTETYGEVGEDGLRPGLGAAIDSFLLLHPEWALKDRFRNNNGLTVLERISGVCVKGSFPVASEREPLPVTPDNQNAAWYVATTPGEGYGQLEILKALGCEPYHRVLEIGCGALVAGFPIMQYLDGGCYTGVDPNAWLFETSLGVPGVAKVAAEKKPRLVARSDFRAGPGEKFDFIVSHSILSHASYEQLDEFFRAVYDQLGPGGKVAASIRLAEGNRFGSPGSERCDADFTEWQYPGVSWFKEETVIERARRAGLSASISPDLQRCILAGNPGAVHDWILAQRTPMMLVTAFFRLPDRPVDEDEQFRRFDELAASGLPIILFLDVELASRIPSYANVRVVSTRLESLWPFQWAEGRDLSLPQHRTGGKDTRDFLLLQNSKIHLLEMACKHAAEPLHFAWIDFGVMKVAEDREEFLGRLKRLDPPASCVLAPGCWGKHVPVTDDGVAWRFCGGFLLADRSSIPDLVARHRAEFEKRPKSLTWEVNIWAAMERAGARFDWYEAGHDETLILDSKNSKNSKNSTRDNIEGRESVTALVTLGDLFTKYGTDKGRNDYTETYERLLDPVRRAPIRILEIGIGTLSPHAFGTMAGFHGPGYAPGGSLRAFRDYCPNARLLGLDVEPDTQFSEERIETGICNSQDALAVAQFFAWRRGDELFDLIIDDGGHWPAMQIATLVNFHQKVAPGGYYVIEDINGEDSYVFHFWEAVVGARFRMVERRVNALVLEKRRIS